MDATSLPYPLTSHDYTMTVHGPVKGLRKLRAEMQGEYQLAEDAGKFAIKAGETGRLLRSPSIIMQVARDIAERCNWGLDNTLRTEPTSIVFEESSTVLVAWDLDRSVMLGEYANPGVHLS